MDVIFAYAAAYGGPPRPTDSWLAFVAGVRRLPQVGARKILERATAQGLAMSGGEGAAGMLLTQLEQTARGG